MRPVLGRCGSGAVPRGWVGASPPPRPRAVPAAPAAPVVQPVPTIAVDPPDGTEDVAPADPITVTATHGKLTGVTLPAKNGAVIPGSLAADGATWTASAPPKF